MVWDYEANCLWVDCAVGISRWEYTAKPFPALKMTNMYPVPGYKKYWGHDLYPVPGTKSLFLTGIAVEQFDTVSRTYKHYSDVICKSISQPFPNGPVMVQIPREQWWTEYAELLDPADRNKVIPFRKRSNMRFYKFRWFVHNDFSYGPLKNTEVPRN